jgi:hypothetical protein
MNILSVIPLCVCVRLVAANCIISSLFTIENANEVAVLTTVFKC